ncbi:hypothetical protein NW755_011625 [Fusarium falciforme]|uniref:Uncharacterized protein n=1 Tax=Fusarium falciforme TaxID=195108 RepID=A0A9W8QXF5_9HYPO|nr:hypothetical protein NW755_011625 [Fusarium falciforme]
MADLALGAVCRPKGTTASQSVTTSTVESSTVTVPAISTTACLTSASETATSSTKSLRFYVNNNQDAYFGGASGNFAG